jgi:hypothetical protein
MMGTKCRRRLTASPLAARKHVEPAFIQGSTEPFTEDAFTEAQPGWWRSMEFLQLLFPILYFEAGQAGTRILKQSLPKLSQ